MTASHEFSAPTVEEAIDLGLQQLNLSREAVEIVVLDEGGKGLFGLGTREARVRLTARAPADAEPPPPAAPSLPTEPVPPAVALPQTPALVDDELLSLARDIVTELIEKMHVDARVSASYAEQEDERRHRPKILVEITGEDLSILIGHQAETLNALEFIARLILGKELGQGVDLEVDVQSYRARRREQLRRIARQMAEQALRTGKRQYLEPMPPNDRRIIHIELREYPGVATESVGEGNRRKVTIYPK